MARDDILLSLIERQRRWLSAKIEGECEGELSSSSAYSRILELSHHLDQLIVLYLNTEQRSLGKSAKKG